MGNFISEHEYETAEDFLDAFMPWSSFHSNLGLKNFIFRGQSNAAFPLIPSALRPDSSDGMKEKMAIYFDTAPEHANSLYRQAMIEYQLIRDFYRISDMSGLYVPESKFLRNLYYKEVEYETMVNWVDGNVWLPDDMLEAAALAQHYGVLTRLMDWTYNPFTAAFFASKPSATGFSKDGQLCVWGLNTHGIHFLQKSYDLLRTYPTNINLPEFPLKLITPPYHGNANLAAQQGLFTHWSTSLPGINSLMTETHQMKNDGLDTLVKNYHNKLSLSPMDNFFIKLTLKNSESEKVAKHLRKLGYGPSTLFPGYAGAVLEIEERPFFTRTRPRDNKAIK